MFFLRMIVIMIMMITMMVTCYYSDCNDNCDIDDDGGINDYDNNINDGMNV